MEGLLGARRVRRVKYPGNREQRNNGLHYRGTHISALLLDIPVHSGLITASGNIFVRWN